MRLHTVVCSGALLAISAATAPAQQTLRVGGLTRVITGNTAKVVDSKPSVAGQRSSTMVRLPIALTSNAPAANPSPPDKGGAQTPPPQPAPPSAVFAPQLEIDPYGLLWDESKNGFTGRVRVGVIDTLHKTQPPVPLPTPITFQLSADGGNVAPENAVVGKTNDYQTVVVSTEMKLDSIRLHVVPLGLEAPVDVAIAVTRVPLDITIRPSMPGFGLGRAEVAVALPIGFRGDSVYVSLTPDRGSVSPEGVWVNPGRPGKAFFWSSGLDSGKVTAKAGGTGIGAASANIGYEWPLGFTVACLIGIVIGGVGTMAFKKLSWTGSNVFAAFGGGFVSGLVAAVAGSLLGVKIASVDPAGGGGLALVFVLAAVGALLGARIIQVVVPGAPAE